MAASYTTELEALNALNDKVDGTNDGIAIILQNYLEDMKSKLNNMNSNIAGIYSAENTINNNVNTLVGATPDVRHQVTNVRIERIYIGDVAEKREKAEEQIADLIAKGYRPYMTLGLSEDLARVVFAKYPAPNNQ